MFAHIRRFQSINRPINIRRLVSILSTEHKHELPDINFSDSKTIYQFKSNWDLFRSFAILKTCSINYFADNSLTVSIE